jgi:hypothetical protein
MGRLLTITNSNATKFGVRKRTVKPELRVGPVSLTFISIAIACILALFYLSQANQAAIKGYDIKSLEDKRVEIITEREQLEVEAASLQSIKEIESKMEINSMVPAKQINYWPATAVASK